MPDLTIKEVKVYVLDRGQIASIVTRSGIEGNYTLGSRYWHPNWSNLGWLDYAKNVCWSPQRPRLSGLDLPVGAAATARGAEFYASAIDNCLWDILGKAVVSRCIAS